MSTRQSLLLIVMLCLINGFDGAYGHLCHDPFRPRDRLILIPERELLRMEREGEFRIYVENAFRSVLRDLRLIITSPAFEIETVPASIAQLVPGEQSFYLVRLKLREGFEPGDYPLKISVGAKSAELRPTIEKIAVVVDEEVPIKALLLIAEGFHDLGTFIPKSRLKEENIKVTIGGIEVGKYRAGYGSIHTLEVEIAARDIKIEEYNALVIPGGKSPAILRESEEVLALVREAYRQGKIIAAICHGPQVLISAGILRGKKATAVGGVKNELLEAGAEFVDAEVVRDGNIITSRLPADLPAFCRALISALKGIEPLQEEIVEPQVEEVGEIVVRVEEFVLAERWYIYLIPILLLTGLLVWRKLRQK